MLLSIPFWLFAHIHTPLPVSLASFAVVSAVIIVTKKASNPKAEMTLFLWEEEKLQQKCLLSGFLLVWVCVCVYN